MDLAAGIMNRDKRAAARLISMFENGEEEAQAILSRLYHHTGKARVIGITGPPGAGKSTLTDKLAKLLRKQNKTVGIIAVDPTSPFTGGSILGDRVRMTDLYTDPGVFIRSMGTRGQLGGLSRATMGAVQTLDLYGADVIFIETVGVGQSEIDIVKAADTVLLVMVPGLGDDIQAIKAGVMEIGDVFAVNKADLPGADRTRVELEMVLDYRQAGWRPPVTPVVAVRNEGIEALHQELERHWSYLLETGELQKRRIQNSQWALMEWVHRSLMDRLMDNEQQKQEVYELAAQVAGREQDPYTAGKILMKRLLNQSIE